MYSSVSDVHSEGRKLFTTCEERWRHGRGGRVEARYIGFRGVSEESEVAGVYIARVECEWRRAG